MHLVCNFLLVSQKVHFYLYILIYFFLSKFSRCKPALKCVMESGCVVYDDIAVLLEQ